MTRRRRATSPAIFVGLTSLIVATSASSALAQTPPPAWTAPAPQGAAPPPATPPPAFPPSLQAGGLTPPPSTTTTAAPQGGPPNATQNDLDKAQKEDSKRGLSWAWAGVEGGLSYADLLTFAGKGKDFTEGFLPAQSLGGVVGVGAGVRLLFFTVGARGRYGLYDPFHMLTVGGEVGMRFPFGRVEPHFELGGGYATLLHIAGLSKGSSDAISISGGYGRLSAGVDVFPIPLLSVGVVGSAEFLGLTRPALSAGQIQAIQDDPSVSDARKSTAPNLATQGTSFGLAAGATAVIGLHF